MLNFSQFEIDLMVSLNCFDTGVVDGTVFEKTGNWQDLNCGCCSSYTVWTLTKTSPQSFCVETFESRLGSRSIQTFDKLDDAMKACV
jgi:hypothetical protein